MFRLQDLGEIMSRFFCIDTRPSLTIVPKASNLTLFLIYFPIIYLNLSLKALSDRITIILKFCT